MGHCWRSKDELISDILLWTLSHGRASGHRMLPGRPAGSDEWLRKIVGQLEKSVLVAWHDDDDDIYIYIYILNHTVIFCPVSMGCKTHRLHPCRRVRPRPMSVLYMIINNLMVSFQWRWGFGECGEPLHCHCSQVLSGPEW